MWGDSPRLRNAVLLIVGGLILVGILTTVWLIEDYWRPAARRVGLAVAPNPDRKLANAALHPGDLQRAFGDSRNYPELAVERGESGDAKVKLRVAPTGGVVGCRIVVSSGSVTLDRATCDLSRRLIRADPARDAQGRPIASDFQLRVRWRLPIE